MRAVVVAIGKVGLPLAAKIALAGHDVVGCDADPTVVELVNAGREPFPGETGLAETLRGLAGSGRLRATGDTTAAVAEGPDLVIAVPPLIVDPQGRPDYDTLDAVIDDIGRGLQAGAVVSVETTLPVGTTRSRIAPRLAAASGLQEERDFFAVHSPERVYAGRIFADLERYPKLVGGLSRQGEERAVALYQAFLSAEVRPMGSAEAAELTKLAETTYRDVNIALANEFARFADRIGVDVQPVIDAANSQPFSHIHRPGIAVGGHCIPVYPRLYLAGDGEAGLAARAREVNDGMPRYAAELLEQALGGSLRGARLLILGVAYRGGVKETAFSGAFALRDELALMGSIVFAQDPLFSAEELEARGFVPWRQEPIDAAIIQADHAEYASLRAEDLPGLRVLLDGRGSLDPAPWGDAGVEVVRIGEGKR